MKLIHTYELYKIFTFFAHSTLSTDKTAMHITVCLIFDHNEKYLFKNTFDKDILQ